MTMTSDVNCKFKAIKLSVINNLDFAMTLQTNTPTHSHTQTYHNDQIIPCLDTIVAPHNTPPPSPHTYNTCCSNSNCNK